MKINRYQYYLWLSLYILLLGGCDTSDNISPKTTETFIRLYGGEFQDKGIGMSILPDNRIAILASTAEEPVVSGEESVNDVVIILTDSAGVNAELYVIGNPDVNEIPSGMAYYDGYLYVGGTTDIHGDNDFLFVKFSLNTTSLISYIPIGFTDTSEICHDIALFENTSAGTGLLLVGEIGINDTTQSFDTWVSLDGDSIGSLIPSARYDGRSKSVVPFNQSYYLTLGEDQSQSADNQVIKLSRVQYSNGVTGDSKDITPEGGLFEATKLLLVNQNIILVNGYASSQGAGNPSVGVILSENQTSPNFPGISGKDFVFIDTIRMKTTDIIRATDGGYLMLGTDTDRNLIKVVKLNFELNTVEWSEVYGTNGELEETGSICQFPDGKILFSATVSYQVGGTNTKIALFKTTSDGKLDLP